MEKDKTIKIFLASSNELKEEREKFGNFIRKLDNIYKVRGKTIHVFEWEDCDASITDCRTQDEYNKKVRASDMFVAMFYTKAGEYTIEEFDVAMDEYQTKGSPKVYVYCKNLNEDEVETLELKAFKDRLNEEGNERFWTNYGNQDYLQWHFLLQFLMVENDLNRLKLEDGTVTLEGIAVAELAELPFAAGNKNYKELKKELDEQLPEDIELAQQAFNEHPDSEKHRNNLQRKLDRKNYLIKEFARLQKALFETSQRIAEMQREQLSDKLRRATEAFKAGNLDGANALLDEIEREAETHYKNLSQDREHVHQDIKVFLLRAKTVMLEVKTPISERIKQVLDIYAKADKWAKESALPDEKYDELLDDYATFLYDYGLYKEAESVLLRLISLREKLYGKKHADTATSYNNIGAFYNDQRDYAKALEYHRKALDIRERMLGLDHPETAQSYNNIGAVYNYQGENSEALEYYGKALDIFERVLGSDHSETAKSYNNIGSVFYDQRGYTKALENFGKALDILERVLGSDHPDTATSYNNIGAVYKEQGDYAKALVYYKKALDIRERVLGPDHPDTATSYNNIGVVYFKQGDSAKALEYLGKALDICKRVLGPDHPDTVQSNKSYNNIVNA